MSRVKKTATKKAPPKKLKEKDGAKSQLSNIAKQVILKSEVAGAKWGRDELWGIRIATDNQVMDALKHFNEADAFLVESN